MERRFNLVIPVQCEEIDDHIGKARAYVTAYGPTDWIIETLENDYGGVKSGEFANDETFQDVTEAVIEYFNGMAERLKDCFNETNEREENYGK